MSMIIVLNAQRSPWFSSKTAGHACGNMSINLIAIYIYICCSCGYCPYGAYQQSKLANILFTYELQRRLLAEGCHVTANALHPGIGNTDLFQNVPSLILTVQKYTISWMFKVMIKKCETTNDSRAEM